MSEIVEGPRSIHGIESSTGWNIRNGFQVYFNNVYYNLNICIRQGGYHGIPFSARVINHILKQCRSHVTNVHLKYIMVHCALYICGNTVKLKCIFPLFRPPLLSLSILAGYHTFSLKINVRAL